MSYVERSTSRRDTTGELLLSIHRLTKEYRPLGPMRVQRLFARLGGLQVDGMLADDVGDDDDDEDEVAEDEVVARTATRRHAINRISLKAYGGSRVALVGPEGAGKTLLLKLIAGIVPPTQGRIVVRGLVAPALTVLARSLPGKGQTLPSAITHVASVAGIPPGTVRSRLGEIADFLEVPRLKGMTTASLDRRRREDVILASMLCVDPDVVLLDIPLPRNEFGERCRARLARLTAGGSLVVVEARDVRKATLEPDRVVQLDAGRVVSDEPYTRGIAAPPGR